MQNLDLPKIRIQDTFYIRQLTVNVFCVHDLKTEKATIQQDQSLRTRFVGKFMQKGKYKVRKLSISSSHNTLVKKLIVNPRFFPRVSNFTEINFDSVEMRLLNKGLNYNFPNNRKTSFLMSYFKPKL